MMEMRKFLLSCECVAQLAICYDMMRSFINELLLDSLLCHTPIVFGCGCYSRLMEISSLM